MSLFEKKYAVEGWNGKIYSLTARQLYERVLEDSKSDYNWIAPASELVRVCNEKDFPEWEATVIKTIILNCFANLELKKECSSRGKPADKQAVYSCFEEDERKESERIRKFMESLTLKINDFYM